MNQELVGVAAQAAATPCPASTAGVDASLTGRSHLHFDDLQNFGERICQALRIPCKHITGLKLVLDAETNFLPVLTVERAVFDAEDLGALRTVCEQYRLVRVTQTEASAAQAGGPLSPTPGP